VGDFSASVDREIISLLYPPRAFSLKSLIKKLGERKVVAHDVDGVPSWVKIHPIIEPGGRKAASHQEEKRQKRF
jgi:hypothetical protein